MPCLLLLFLKTVLLLLLVFRWKTSPSAKADWLVFCFWWFCSIQGSVAQVAVDGEKPAFTGCFAPSFRLYVLLKCLFRAYPETSFESEKDEFQGSDEGFFWGHSIATASKKCKVRFLKGAFYGQRRFPDRLLSPKKPVAAFGIFRKAFSIFFSLLKYSKCLFFCRDCVRNIPNAIPAMFFAFGIFQIALFFSQVDLEYSKRRYKLPYIGLNMESDENPCHCWMIDFLKKNFNFTQHSTNLSFYCFITRRFRVYGSGGREYLRRKWPSWPSFI